MLAVSQNYAGQDSKNTVADIRCSHRSKSKGSRRDLTTIFAFSEAENYSSRFYFEVISNHLLLDAAKGFLSQCKKRRTLTPSRTHLHLQKTPIYWASTLRLISFDVTDGALKQFASDEERIKVPCFVRVAQNFFRSLERNQFQTSRYLPL